ncbi:MAG: hypothetical protein Q8N99_06800 [Nanoarchaeota archaeon]|nr:hypothetical protein [Nanoarchaeota archaeon]
MKTVLLEGSELSGKTTIAETIKRRLVEEGFDVTLNIGPIDKKALKVGLPLQIADKIKLPSFQELMYTISLITDGNPKELYGSDFFLQERYFPSVMAYASILNSVGINRYFGNWLKRVYQKFDYNVLIKTSIDSRLERISQRERKTKLDKMVEANPQLSADLERAIQKVLSNERNYFEIDTDEMCAEEAANEVIRRIT